MKIWSCKTYRKKITGKLHEEFIRFVEQSLIEVIVKNQNNQCSAAARILGLHRTTLKKKLDQYGMSQE